MEAYTENPIDKMYREGPEGTRMDEETVDKDEMDETEPTQATQLVVDPRRLGHHNSGFDDQDLTDIICILHPASLSACRAVAMIAEDAPQHTISIGGAELKLRDDPINKHHQSTDEPDTFELAAQGIVSRDIALRFSALLKDPLGGFRFGRHPQRCDFILGRGNTDGAKRISNVHFRIYINEHGIIMLEDQSTNGTMVESVMLRGKDKENNRQYRHTLQQGDMITLLMTPPDEDLKFLVRIPQRESHVEDEYEQNLQGYFQRLRNIHDARELQRMMNAVPRSGDNTAPPDGPPDIFGPPAVLAKSIGLLDSRPHIKEWKGGSKYNKVHQIGKGAFATVYLITTKFDGVPFAAKELEKRRFMKNGILDQKVDMEMKIMRKIKHPNIVQYIEHIDWDDYLYLIMEFVPGGDLGHLVSGRGHLPEPMVHSIASQMLSALNYLHQQNITHRDVKPDNILIHSLEPVQVKLTDFGLSKVVDTADSVMKTFCGTLLYCAPEVYSEYREYDEKTGLRTRRGKGKENLPPQRYNHGVDVYSLGGVLFYALCGAAPYPAKSNTSYQELLNEIMTKALDVRPLQRVEVSEKAIRCVKSMLAVRPENRPSIRSLQAFPWLTGESSARDPDEYDDDDQVDMVGEDYADENLEQGASQLRLQDEDMLGSQIDYFDDEIVDVDADEVDLIRALTSESEAPNSQSSASESFAYMKNLGNGPRRLFGEVGVSALRSSGAIPQSQLNLPSTESIASTKIDSNDNASPSPQPAKLDNHHQKTEPRDEIQRIKGNIHINTTPSTEEIPVSFAQQTHAFEGSVTAPSLMGAESMVGHMQMNSPSPAAMSPQMPTLPVPPAPQLNASMRRPRDDDDREETRPNPKRMKSDRQIDIVLSKSVFWSKDKSTWHQNYPAMTLSEFNELDAKAKARGETFTHGQKMFDELISGYNQTTVSSLDPKARAESEPIIEQGRRAMLERDDRKMDETIDQDAALPATSYSNLATMTGLNIELADTESNTMTQVAALSRSDVASHGGVVISKDNATSGPLKAVLARLTPTHDSLMQFTLDVTENLFTWGRGHDNTHQFPDQSDTRVSKYAMKIILANPYSELKSDSQSSLAFYIATKATFGIAVNGVAVRACEPKSPYAAMKFWGELKSGDHVCVFGKESQGIAFIFDAFVGSSQERRTDERPFTIIKDEAVIKELDELGRQLPDQTSV